jgi:hypothetical protein
MGHGKYGWWIDEKPVEEIGAHSGNWLIHPIFVESITEVK